MKRSNNPIYYVAGWLTLTLSLVGWWFIYGLRQLDRVAKLEHGLPNHLLEQQRMLQWEGGSLLFLLIIGGGALLYYSFQEKHRSDRVKEFFATLTHELKTPLASLRLQAESLQEDLAGTSHSQLVERLVQDTVRLELQLENALFLASVRSREQFHLESLTVKDLVEKLKSQWPEVTSEDLSPSLKVKADSRALEGILKNLFQNARVHGKAGQISVKAETLDRFVKLSVLDNGRGFKGNRSKLGNLFMRPTTGSGSGIGLYLSKTLAQSMNGALKFDGKLGKGLGFSVDVILERGEEF